MAIDYDRGRELSGENRVKTLERVLDGAPGKYCTATGTAMANLVEVK